MRKKQLGGTYIIFTIPMQKKIIPKKGANNYKLNAILCQLTAHVTGRSNNCGLKS